MTLLTRRRFAHATTSKQRRDDREISIAGALITARVRPVRPGAAS